MEVGRGGRVERAHVVSLAGGRWDGAARHGGCWGPGLLKDRACRGVQGVMLQSVCCCVLLLCAVVQKGAPAGPLGQGGGKGAAAAAESGKTAVADGEAADGAAAAAGAGEGGHKGRKNKRKEEQRPANWFELKASCAC